MKSPTVASVLASLLRDGGSLAYAAAAALGAPYFLRRKKRLLQKGRSDIEFDMARWSVQWNDEFANRAPDTDATQTGPRVAFVLASWGEVATMTPLIQALRRERPDARLLISVERREAIASARALSDEPIVPFPFDNPLPVARWHARVRPDVVVFFEQFDFPTVTRSLWMRRVPYIVIQARVNDSRGLGYKRHTAQPKFKRWQLRGLSTMLLTSAELRELIAPVLSNETKLQIVGSLKFSGERPQIATESEAALKDWIGATTGDAPLFVAGSTHATEEAFILDALEIVRREYQGIAPVVLLAPRRLHRVEEVERLLNERGVHFSRRSQWKPNKEASTVDVLLLDTLGELGVAYRYGMAAFVGGTISGASHNVAEPLVWGVPVAYGPIRGNFEVEQTLCESAGVGFRIETPEALANHWLSLLESSERRDELGRKAQNLVEAQRGAFARSLQTLIEAVDAISASNDAPNKKS